MLEINVIAYLPTSIIRAILATHPLDAPAAYPLKGDATCREVVVCVGRARIGRDLAGIRRMVGNALDFHLRRRHIYHKLGDHRFMCGISCQIGTTYRDGITSVGRKAHEAPPDGSVRRHPT